MIPVYSLADLKAALAAAKRENDAALVADLQAAIRRARRAS